MKAYLNRLLICVRWQFQPKGIRKSCWRDFSLCWDAFAYLIVGAVGLPLAILAFALLPLRLLGTCFYAAFKYSDEAVGRLQRVQAKAAIILLLCLTQSGCLVRQPVKIEEPSGKEVGRIYRKPDGSLIIYNWRE